MNENLNSQFYKKSSNRDITEKINLLGIRLKPSVFQVLYYLYYYF